LHPLREKMTVRLANAFGFKAERVEDVPEGLLELWSVYPYCELVRPLIHLERKKRPDVSYEKLAIEFGLTKSRIYRIANKAPYIPRRKS